MLEQFASFAARSVGAALADVRSAQRWAVRAGGGLAGAAALEALDALLASRFLDAAAARVVESRLLGEAVAELLEREELWLLVDEIARSPSVTEAIAHQGAGFADQIAGEVRERSQHADAQLERAARRVLRRRGRPRSPPAAPGAG